MKRVLIALAVVLLLVAGAVTWVLTTPQGARLVLDRVASMAGDGITLEGVEGSLGGPLSIRVIEVSRPDLYARVEGFTMDTSPLAPLRGRLLVHDLRAEKVELRTVDTGATARVPASFAPPYPVRLERGSIGELRLGDLPEAARAEPDLAKKRALMAAARGGDLVVRDIFLRGEGDRGYWKVDEARALTPHGSVRLAGTLASEAPFALDAKVALEGIAAERPYKADVQAKGTLKSLEATLAAVVSGQPATGRAVIEPFSKVPVRLVELRARDVDLAAHGAGPRTRLALDLRLAAADGGAFAGPVRIDNAEPGRWDLGGLPFNHAAARVVVRPERIDVADLQLALLGGGSAAGRATLTRAGIEADLEVAALDLSALHGELQKTRVTGRIAASGDQAAQKFEVALKDPRFGIEGRGALAGERLTVETARVSTGGGAVVATGHLELAGSKAFRFEGRAEHFDPSAFVKTGKGDLNFTFVTSGSLGEAMAGEAKLDLAPSTYAGLPASGRLAIAGNRRRIASADVDLGLGQARLQAKGSFGAAGDAMRLGFRAPNLAALSKPLGVAVAGSIEGEANLTGTFQSPAGSVAFTAADLRLPSNVFVRALDGRLQAGVDPASRIEGKVSAKGVAIGEEVPPTPLASALEATLAGTRADHRLEVAADMRRDTRVTAAFAGGLDPKAKAPSWSGRLEALAMTGRGAFRLERPATLALSAQRIELGEALLRGGWGEARSQVARWTPRTLDLKGSSAGIQVQNLARSLRLGTVPRSNLVLAADWDIRAAEQFDGSLSLRRVSGDLRVGEPPLALGLETLELRADVVRGRAQARLTVAGERAGKITGEGTALIARGASGWELAPGAPVQAKLVAVHTNLEALAPWLGPESRLGGDLNADLAVSGTGDALRLAGTLRAVDLTAREPQSGFEVEQGQVALRLDGRSLTIERFTATTPWRPSEAARERMRRVDAPEGGGRITASGAVDLAARTGAITLRAEKVPVQQVPSRFAALSGEARLEAHAQELAVTGAFTVDAGWIGAPEEAPPSMSEDIVVVRAAQPAAADPDATPAEPIRLDLRVGLGDRLYFQGLGLDTRLAGDVRVHGVVGTALRANGTIRTVGGTYDGYGQKLAIERGVLTLEGPIDNPSLNVLALRKGLPVEAGVEVLGTLVRPKVRLVSVPEVPEPEKLSWLVLGRGAADASLGDSAVMMAAAQALLGGSNPGSDLTKRLGFDEIKIGRADSNSVLGVLPQSTVAGRTGSPSAAEVVSVGRRINRSVHLTYEQGLADAEGALKLTWRLTRRFQVLVRAGYLPGVDAVYRWVFP